MPRAQLVVLLDSEWLIAGGSSTLGSSDMAPLLDAEQLPTIPGRTLRGLLRESVAMIDDCSPPTQHADRLFGVRKNGDDRLDAGDGSIRIGNALLVDAIASECFEPARRADLFVTIKRTALDAETRTARTGSLREMEVAIAGLELVADVDAATRDDLELLAFSCGLLRSLGHSRSRGLGRCRFELWIDGKHQDQQTLPASAGKGGAR